MRPLTRGHLTQYSYLCLIFNSRSDFLTSQQPAGEEQYKKILVRLHTANICNVENCMSFNIGPNTFS